MVQEISLCLIYTINISNTPLNHLVTLTPVSTRVLVQNQVSRVHIFILKSHELSNLPSVKPQCFVSSYLD